MSSNQRPPLLLAGLTALALCLAAACGASKVSLGPPSPPVAGQVIEVRGEWLKLKGNAVDALFHVRNLTEGPLWVPLAELKCARGEASGWADASAEHRRDGMMYLGAGQQQEVLLICRGARGDAPGPFRVVFERVLGPDADGRPGAELARWFVWEVPAAALVE